jgi:hypothetical protein
MDGGPIKEDARAASSFILRVEITAAWSAGASRRAVQAVNDLVIEPAMSGAYTAQDAAIECPSFGPRISPRAPVPRCPRRSHQRVRVASEMFSPGAGERCLISPALRRTQVICHRAPRVPIGFGGPSIVRALSGHLGIDLGTQKNDNGEYPEPSHKADDCAERAVGLVELPEVCLGVVAYLACSEIGQARDHGGRTMHTQTPQNIVRKPGNCDHPACRFALA